MYKFVINTSGGNLTTVASATGPNGANLIGATGWSFTVNSSTQFTVTHPLGQNIMNAFVYGVGASLSWMRTFSSTTGVAALAMSQDLAYTSCTFYGLSVQFLGTSTSPSTVNIFMLALL